MQENFQENLQYNSCTARGICSINPRTASLQNVLGLYLHLCAKYYLKIIENNNIDDSIKTFLLHTVSVAASNPEGTESGFMEIIEKLKDILTIIIKQYCTINPNETLNEKSLIESDLFKKCSDMITTIKFGEEISRKTSNKVSSSIRDLYKIMLVLSKNISIAVLDLESFGYIPKEGLKQVLILLKTMDFENIETDTLKKLIEEAAQYYVELTSKLHSEQEKRYGLQGIKKVSYTTTPSKAVLVVGSNIRELEDVLEELKDSDIDIYTHDDMMLAHMFPKFSEYKNLKGQYGHGLENCLIDFATFPGPIILTKHSLHNIENLYRGRLFTTDSALYKGVIQISKNNFSEVIQSANNAKGFKTGKKCESVKIGYDINQLTDLINKKMNTNKYKKFVLIGLSEYENENKNKAYYENLIRITPKDCLIISLSKGTTVGNLISINTCFDSYAIIKIFKLLQEYQIPIGVFNPKCDREGIATLIYFSSKYKNVKTFMNQCPPVMFNPSFTKTLKKVFGINITTSAKKDLEYFLNCF